MNVNVNVICIPVPVYLRRQNLLEVGIPTCWKTHKGCVLRVEWGAPCVG